MWRRPLAIFPVVLWHICHETDNQPFALILKDNCDDCWQDVGRAAEQGLSLPILWDELCSELAAQEVPSWLLILSWSFMSTINIIRHWKTHTGDKPFKCSICTRTFSLRDSCVRHLRTVHKELVMQWNRFGRCSSWQITTYTIPSVCEPKCCCRWSPTMSLTWSRTWLAMEATRIRDWESASSLLSLREIWIWN